MLKILSIRIHTKEEEITIYRIGIDSRSNCVSKLVSEDSAGLYFCLLELINGGSSKIQSSCPLEVVCLSSAWRSVVRPASIISFFLVENSSDPIALPEFPRSFSPLRSVYQLTRTSPPLPDELCRVFFHQTSKYFRLLLNPTLRHALCFQIINLQHIKYKTYIYTFNILLLIIQ